MRYNPKKQMQAILDVLAKGDKTVNDIATALTISTEVVRRRMNTLKQRQKARIADWIVSPRSFTPVWGIGNEEDAPKRVSVKIDVSRPRLAMEVRGCKQKETVIDQSGILEKLKDRIGCGNYSIFADMISCDVGMISRVRCGSERLSPLLFLRVATVLDVSPKALAREVGLPEYFFLEKRRTHD